MSPIITRDDLPPTPDWHHVNRDPVLTMPLLWDGDNG